MTLGKFLAIAAAVLIGGFLALGVIKFVLGLAIAIVFKIAIPVAIIIGLIYIVYRVTDRKSIGSSERGILP